MTTRVKLAVVGAGLIGRRHVEHAVAAPQAHLMAIVDPAAAGADLAKAHGVPHYASLAALLAADKPDGLIIATPTQTHVANGLEAIAAGIPALIEKPLADSIADGLRLVEAAEAANVPLLVGHHRRHNPIIRRAKEAITHGRLGRIVTAHGFFWLMKPDDYFDVGWRREKGAGPVLTNLIHDMDLLRHLVGEVVAVQAIETNAIRGYPVEETMVALVRFQNGAVATVNVSDTVVAPWSWEQTAAENPAYPPTDQICLQIAGTHGALAIPRLELWSNPGKRSWWEPLRAERLHVAPQDPLRLQIAHFCAVVQGAAKPVVSGRDGLRTLAVIDALKRAAKMGTEVRVAAV